MSAARPDADQYGLRIEDLAQATGATVRNIRVYQEKGLLPPPVRKGRTALYGPDHQRRLEVVLRLLDRGYTFATIDELFTADRLGLTLSELIAAENSRVLRRTPSRRRPYLLSEAHALVGHRFSEHLLKAGHDIGVAEGPSPEAGILTDTLLYEMLREMVNLGMDEVDIAKVADMVFEGQERAAQGFEVVLERLRDRGYDDARAVDRAIELVEHAGRAVRTLFQSAARRRIAEYFTDASPS